MVDPQDPPPDAASFVSCCLRFWPEMLRAAPELAQDPKDRASELFSRGLDAMICRQPGVHNRSHQGYRLKLDPDAVVGIVDYEEGYRLVVFRRDASLILEPL